MRSPIQFLNYLQSASKPHKYGKDTIFKTANKSFLNTILSFYQLYLVWESTTLQTISF